MLIAEVNNPNGLRLTKSDTDGTFLHFDAGEKQAGLRLDTLDNCSSVILSWAEKQFKTPEQPPAGEMLNHPHLESANCPTYYDGCHCTVEALIHNIERADKAEASREELLDACGELVKFCYPDGKWRGWNNMKGILEIIQPVRRLAEKRKRKL